MKAWWKQRSAQEQRLLLILALFLGMVIAVYGVVKPLNALVVSQQHALKKLRAERQWLDEQALASGIVAVVKDPTPLTDTIQRTAAAAGLTVTVTSTGKNSVGIAASHIPLSALISWLESLRDDKGIYPQILNFTTDDAAGGLITITALQLVKAE